MGTRGSALTVRFPTSDAYWNLRAEQVMNKVFETPVFESRDLEPVEVAVHEPPPPHQPLPPSQPVRTNNGLLGLLTVVAVTGVVSSGWLLSHWLNSRDQLAQERSLLMLERLRNSAAPQPAEASATLSPAAPEPAWMDELQPLPLTPVPPIPGPPIPTGPLPQLTGVVQGPGGNSSAIFQLGSNSLSAGLGEAIGSSGWVLDSVSESGAVIRRNGQRHTLAVGGVF